MYLSVRQKIAVFIILLCLSPLCSAQNFITLDHEKSLQFIIATDMQLNEHPWPEGRVYTIEAEKKVIAHLQLGCYPSDYEDRLNNSLSRIGRFYGVWDTKNSDSDYNGLVILNTSETSRYYDYICIYYNELDIYMLERLILIILSMK